MPFRDTTHHEDRCRRQVGLAGREVGQPDGGDLGVLHQAQLVLERRELADESGGAARVDLGAELERVAQSLAGDAEPVEVRDLAGLLGPPARLGHLVVARHHEVGQADHRG